MIVRELLTRLGFAVDSNKLKQYEGATNNIKRSANDAANSFRNMFAAFVGIQGLKSLANLADNVQSLEARIAQLPQTIGESGTAFDDVAKRAIASRQNLDAYANLYIKIQNAGKDFISTQEEGLKITDTLSKALIVGGASAQERASAMLQFAQAIGSGVLQGDELRSMSEAAPQFMDELAKAIGIPRAELKKFASQGNLTSKMVIEAVGKMSATFDDKFKQMPITIGQAGDIIGGRWAMVVARLNRESQAVTKTANFFLMVFDKIEGGISSLVKFLGGALPTIKLFGIILAAALAPFAIRMFVGALMTLFSTAGLLFVGLVGLGLVLEDLYQYFTGGESATGKLIEAFKKGEAWAIALTAGLTVLVAWQVKSLVQFALMQAAALKTAIRIAASWLIALAPVLAWPIAIAAIITALYMLWDRFGDQIKQLFIDIWQFIKNTAITAFNDLFNEVTKIIGKVKSLWNGVTSIFSGLGETISSTIKSSADLFITPPSLASASGASTTTSNSNITINQTLPPGTPQETAIAAKNATKQALNDGRFARKMEQAQ